MQEMKDPSRKPMLFYCLITMLIMLVLNSTLFPMMINKTVNEVSYDTFMSMTENKQISEAEIKDDEIVFKGTDDKIYKTTATEDSARTERLYKAGVKFSQIDTQPSLLSSILMTWVLPLLPFILIGWFMNRRLKNMSGGDGMMFGLGGGSGAKVYVQSSTSIRFADVAGEDEAKDLLSEIVDFLHSPKKYSEIGAKLPKGALLVGPPGTGKTLLAKAVAGEAGVPFFSISGSDFVEMFVGVGASRVRDLFDTAKKQSPCIIFIDEIDAVGRHRGAGLGGGHDEREQTLNQLLVEMDGFGVNEGVIIIAATNRPDILDPALLRPGRFDRQVVVDAPDVKGREEILKVHSKGKPLAADVDLSVIAKTTIGFSGADLENLMNEAALAAARKGAREISMFDIEDSIMKVVAGPEKKSRKVTERERRLTAFHEAGHAVVSKLLPTQDRVHQVSIIPRGRAGGYTLSLPKDDTFFNSKTEMLEEIVSLLGGRVAEQLFLGDISTGASNDIERATNIAKSMVTKYGMSERLGARTFGDQNNEVFIGLDYGHTVDYSQETAAVIDEEIHKIIDECYKRCTDILNSHRESLTKVAELLLEKEKIEGEEFDALFAADSKDSENPTENADNTDTDNSIE